MKQLIMQSSPATFSLLGQNILLSTLFSNIFIQCSSRSVRPNFTSTQNKR